MQRSPDVTEDSDEERPLRQPNTIGDPGAESPTALRNLRRIWRTILWTRLTCTPFITVTDLNDAEQIYPGTLSYVILWLGVNTTFWTFQTGASSSPRGCTPFSDGHPGASGPRVSAGGCRPWAKASCRTSS